MASTTTNLGLTKPADTDAADISVINGNMDIIDAYASNTNNTFTSISGLAHLGTFGTIAELETLLNNKLSAMQTETINTFTVTASATVGVFVNTYVYMCSLYKKSSTGNYSHVMIYPNAEVAPISGFRAAATTWSFEKIAMGDMSLKLSCTRKTIPTGGSNTFTFSATYASALVVYQSYTSAEQGVYLLTRATTNLINTPIKSSSVLTISMNTSGVVTIETTASYECTLLIVPILNSVS